MDRCEAVLLVAEKALEEVRELRETIDQLKQEAPKRAVSFLISEAGDLLLRDENGGQTNLGNVRGPEGNKGADGAEGKPGRDAEPVSAATVVAELLAGDEVKTLTDMHVAEAFAKFLEAHPIRDGRDGAIGPVGPIGPEGKKGEDGADGVSVAGAVVDRDGCLIITTSKGVPMNLGKVVGKDGNDGKPGADFSEASIDYDGERGLIIRGKGGAEIVRRLPIPMNKGFWRESMACEKADIVTHNGTAWIALKDTTAKPCIENADDWQLFARKGRDGVDGKNGRDLGPAPPVKLNSNG